MPVLWTEVKILRPKVIDHYREDFELEIPDDLCCPISHELRMYDSSDL